MAGSARPTALSKMQERALIVWWTYKDRRTSPDIMPEEASYQTLLALERRGLIAHLRRDGWGGATSGSWRADVTEEGQKLAEQLAQAAQRPD